jgi:hypothetical protein
VFTDVAAEEYRHTGFDHLYDGILQLVDLGVDICKVLDRCGVMVVELTEDGATAPDVAQLVDGVERLVSIARIVDDREAFGRRVLARGDILLGDIS